MPAHSKGSHAMLGTLSQLFAAASGKIGNLVLMQGGRSSLAVRQYVATNSSATLLQLASVLRWPQRLRPGGIR